MNRGTPAPRGQPSWPHAAPQVDISRDKERLGGRFTLFHLRSDGTGWMTADPLGLGLIYRAETRDLVVASNRAELAARLTVPDGGTVPRDIEAMGLLALTGSLHGDRTGFETVRVLPQASILHLEPDRDPRIETWSPMPWWDADAPQDLDDAVARCVDRLRTRVRLMAAPAAHRATCELTGGKDSRLMLALLLAEGLAHEVEFLTWGNRGTPDVELATMLAERFGLDHRVGTGAPVVRTGRAREPSPMTTGDGWRTRPIDHEARFRHHVWASSGALSLWDLHTTTWPPVPGLALCGLVGEVLRTNYSTSDQIATMGRLEHFVDRGGFGFDAAGLLRSEAAAHLRAVVIEQLRSVRPPDGDARDAVDGFYQRGRLRRWGGAQAELGTRHRAHPLYDLESLRSAFAVGGEARRGELVHHGLLRACAPDLIKVPFAGAWTSRRTGRRRRPVSWDIALLPTRRRLHRSRHRLVVDLVRRRRPTPNTAETSRMKGLAEKRDVLRSLLDVPHTHSTWDLYDRRRTLDALARIETLPTLGRAELHHAATVATWLDHGEQRADLYAHAPGT